MTPVVLVMSVRNNMYHTKKSNYQDNLYSHYVFIALQLVVKSKIITKRSSLIIRLDLIIEFISGIE